MVTHLAALLALATPAAVAPPQALPAQARLDAALVESVRASCPKTQLRLEPALARAAARFAQAVEEGKAAPSESALSFYASLESVDPVTVAGIAVVDVDFADRAVGDLYSRACRFDRAGVAAARYRDRAVVALLAAEHGIDLAAIPGQVEVGAEVEVRGELPRGFLRPKLFVLTPRGTVEQQDLSAQGGFGLRARASLDQRGEYTIEVLAEDAGGPRVLALRRVFAGVAPPLVPPAAGPRAAGGTGTGAVVDAIAALRAARGLPALVRDPTLDAIAERHSRQMARAKVFAHILKADGDLEARLDSGGYAYRVAAENIGFADTPAMAHRGIEVSPAHLANLIDPRMRRIGLGAVQGHTREGNAGVYLTEVFAQPIVGLGNPAAAVATAINRHRTQAGLAPLVRDARLDEVAEHVARAKAFLGGPVLVGDAATQARAAAPELASASAHLSVGTQPEDVLLAKDVDAPVWTRLGVGALYASSKTYGPGRLWVLVIFAR